MWRSGGERLQLLFCITQPQRDLRANQRSHHRPNDGPVPCWSVGVRPRAAGYSTRANRATLHNLRPIARAGLAARSKRMKEQAQATQPSPLLRRLRQWSLGRCLRVLLVGEDHQLGPKKHLPLHEVPSADSLEAACARTARRTITRRATCNPTAVQHANIFHSMKSEALPFRASGPCVPIRGRNSSSM